MGMISGFPEGPEEIAANVKIAFTFCSQVDDSYPAGWANSSSWAICLRWVCSIELPSCAVSNRFAGAFGMQMPIKLLMPALAFSPRTGVLGQYSTMRWFRVSRIGLAAYLVSV